MAWWLLALLIEGTHLSFVLPNHLIVRDDGVQIHTKFLFCFVHQINKTDLVAFETYDGECVFPITLQTAAQAHTVLIKTMRRCFCCHGVFLFSSWEIDDLLAALDPLVYID